MTSVYDIGRSCTCDDEPDANCPVHGAGRHLIDLGETPPCWPELSPVQGSAAWCGLLVVAVLALVALTLLAIRA